ncbi:hypothetical protein DOTSEDRAFT_45970 [Dothistroma septosporum NZE10]|uniref:Uncharacterized protein n=1 Tax=Dothistroma septosporum (strain NZE10 / CBS 128990) TaxID=675120 RepID=N1PLK9_DOTSN|nr:hypothetical protein DOTSEDRAFT_45970 [Dothistroma septosporum NZE10]
MYEHVLHDASTKISRLCSIAAVPVAANPSRVGLPWKLGQHPEVDAYSLRKAGHPSMTA